ncbi:MAG: peptidoglycan DD-metalloendopeptidase family protein [Patescibacteria group bacterium]|nr:peptidoglycan DD-metalloendopeptidase family protein [Patescibacteria group bacterium]
MKYNIWLKILYSLIYLKRVLKWVGEKLFSVFGRFFGFFWKLYILAGYKTGYYLKKIGVDRIDALLLKRDNLQILIFITLLFLVIPQSTIFAKKRADLAGRKTIAYGLTGMEDDASVLEEITSGSSVYEPTAYRLQGFLGAEQASSGNVSWQENGFSGPVAGGSSLYKPLIFPGVSLSGGRVETIEYAVAVGDTLSGIAARFGISVATILWENNLTLNSRIKPGDKLRILPVSGVSYTVKKGDTLKKIASTYGVVAEDIAKFNKLKEDGSNLAKGETLIIPGGIKPQQKSYASVPSSYAGVKQYAAPSASKQQPTNSGFVWPAGAKIITQYYGWTHHGLDIAGPFATPIYAAKSGTVEISQCGWNSGYGCYIVINHGGGVKTLYGHNSRLLVTPGDYVTTGQTISLMGNTGKVRGVTGIHLHFEIQINGARVNPLGYVR